MTGVGQGSGNTARSGFKHGSRIGIIGVFRAINVISGIAFESRRKGRNMRETGGGGAEGL